MITLYQFPPAWGLPNASPFCMKVETYLRMCNLPYTTVNVLNPAKGPKGKLPHITDGANTVADSGLILDYLKATYGDKLDAGLDSRTRAEAHALRRLMEEHLYWCAVYDRWAVDENWALTKPAFFGACRRGCATWSPRWRAAGNSGPCAATASAGTPPGKSTHLGAPI